MARVRERPSRNLPRSKPEVHLPAWQQRPARPGEWAQQSAIVALSGRMTQFAELFSLMRVSFLWMRQFRACRRGPGPQANN